MQQKAFCFIPGYRRQKMLCLSTDMQRLLEGEHKIDKKPIQVVRRPPKKKLPPDPLRVHVQGLNLEKTSKDCLTLYLEKFSNVEVKEVYFGFNDNALAVFGEEPGKNVAACSFMIASVQSVS